MKVGALLNHSKLLAVLTSVLALALGTGSASAEVSTPSLAVSGNQLVTAAGAPLHIAGVNRSGTEYACAQGWGIFDGPSDDASVAAIASWGVNAVRVPLNEDCWLGINGVPPAYAGANYQSAIESYVNLLLAHGLDVILDLHWSAPRSQLALAQEQAPDADHAPAFWSSVASAFKGVNGVAFDLFNEPHDISWACWRNGCTMPGGWQAAGMQQLLDAVRAAGATQPVIAEGLSWGADLSGWLANEPHDPDGQLVAGWHIYNFSTCNTVACWDATVSPVAQRVPVLASEIGENDCAGTFLNTLLPWADSHRIGYLAWAWNTAGCASGPSLISDYSGTPTAYGAAYESYIQSYLRGAPLDPAARFDFEDGTADGWGVRWGSTLSLGNETGISYSGTHGLALEVAGKGYPAAAVSSGLTGAGPGSSVSYHVWAPPGAAVGVAPVVIDSKGHFTVAPEQPLKVGWSTVTFTIPAGVDGVGALGLQVEDSGGWVGELVLDDVSWQNAPAPPPTSGGSGSGAGQKSSGDGSTHRASGHGSSRRRSSRGSSHRSGHGSSGGRRRGSSPRSARGSSRRGGSRRRAHRSSGGAHSSSGSGRHRKRRCAQRRGGRGRRCRRGSASS